jgi:hypothetical protein
MKGQGVEKLKELESGTLYTTIRDTMQEDARRKPADLSDTMQEDAGKHRNRRKPADLRDTESAQSLVEGSDK